MKKLILLIAALAAAHAQVQAPDTPAGRQFSRWLEVFNRGERSALLEFFSANLPERVEHIDDALDFRKNTGGFDLRKIEESTPTKLVGVVQERGGSNFARFRIEVDAAEPHRILDLGLQQIQNESPGPAPSRMSEKDALAALRVEIEKRVSDDRFSGAVLVAKDGKPVFTGAYGLADREKKTPNQLDTRFRIGSMNKMFTATSIMQLVAAGKIGLKEPVGKYLTDYPNKDIAAKVTIHHLLTHSGGTGDFFGPEYDANRLKLRELKDYVALFGTRGPAFEPGAKFEYSNFGFILLGRIIEKVSGQSYYDYVREHVFRPAGMTRTDSISEDETVSGRATGYMKAKGAWKPNTDTLPYRGTSAGGGYSTVEDLLRFANAILGHKLLSQQDTATLTTGKVPTGPAGKYAYGFGDFNRDGVHWFGHNGGAPGMNGDLRIFPESGYVIAVLANLDPPAAGQVADFVAARLPLK
jgi:D-alanyl-D-alanine carboxypeptidase